MKVTFDTLTYHMFLSEATFTSGILSPHGSTPASPISPPASDKVPKLGPQIQQSSAGFRHCLENHYMPSQDACTGQSTGVQERNIRNNTKRISLLIVNTWLSLNPSPRLSDGTCPMNSMRYLERNEEFHRSELSVPSAIYLCLVSGFEDGNVLF